MAHGSCENSLELYKAARTISGTWKVLGKYSPPLYNRILFTRLWVSEQH